MAKKSKKVEKVSIETGVDVKDLERLPVEAIDKLDALVPDADLDVLGDDIHPDQARQIIGHKADGTPIFMPKA